MTFRRKGPVKRREERRRAVHRLREQERESKSVGEMEKREREEPAEKVEERRRQEGGHRLVNNDKKEREDRQPAVHGRSGKVPRQRPLLPKVWGRLWRTFFGDTDDTFPVRGLCVVRKADVRHLGSETPRVLG
jgi:hypothetical protein